MPKISDNKPKTKPVFKTYLWIGTFITKDNSKWNVQVARNILSQYNPLESWKGKLLFFNDYFQIKSKSKSFSHKYKFSELCGLYSTPFSRNVLIIGLFQEHLNYIVMRFDNLYNKDRTIVEINKIKGPDETEASEMDQVDSKIDLNNQEQTSENHFQNSLDKALQISENDNHFNETSNGVIRKSEIGLTLSIPSETEDDDWDYEPSKGIMWVENTKYIEYKPYLGRHVETDDGSVYMYCAQQVLSSNNGVHNSNTDSD